MTIEFFVPGIPATAGSKKPFIYRAKADGKQRVAMVPDNKRQKPWMSDVKLFASVNTERPIDGPVKLILAFYMPRPKCHYGTGKNSDVLKSSAPSRPITKPDLTKMIRAVEDALTGVCWRDDCQVVTQITCKHYGDQPGVHVTVEAA